tara:strand:+ start:297 stop:668 length:372 start_codon:yes stop_codon:yes gene_type:complete
MGEYNSQDLVAKNEILSESSSISVETVDDAMSILSELHKSIVASEQAKQATNATFSSSIERYIYSLNREVIGQKESKTQGSILPYVENQSGSELERVQRIRSVLTITLDLLNKNENIFSLLDD